MESHLVLMLEQRWDIKMVPLMFIMMARLRAYCFETQCSDGKVIGSDEGIKLGLSGCKVLGTILWKYILNHMGYTDGNITSLEG